MKLFNLCTIFYLVAAVYSLRIDHPYGTGEPGTIPGTTSHYVVARNHTYHFLQSHPPSNTTTPKGTIILFHGFPDFSYAWRYQVPFLTSKGYRVIIPDLLGYADTDSPCELSNWTMKEMSEDIASLLSQVAPGEQVIVGGHDWGAALTYMFAMWHPNLVKALFTIAIPYTKPWFGPTTAWADMQDLVDNGTCASLAYQLQWRDVSIDRNFSSTADIRTFLTASYGGVTPDGLPAVEGEVGIIYDRLPLLGPSPLVSGAEFELYVDKISAKGMRGAFNWYRTRRMNWEDEQVFNGSWTFGQPSLFIVAERDAIILPRYFEDMGSYFEDLRIESVDSDHWALWEAREDVNAKVGEWIAGLE